MVKGEHLDMLITRTKVAAPRKAITAHRPGADGNCLECRQPWTTDHYQRVLEQAAGGKTVTKHQRAEWEIDLDE